MILEKMFFRGDGIAEKIERASPRERQQHLTATLYPDKTSERGSRQDILDFAYSYDGTKLGTGMMYLHFDTKSLEWVTFYPFLSYDGQPKYQQRMKTHGIGTLATFGSIVKTLQLYPQITGDYKIKHFTGLSEQRKKQLERLGITDPTALMNLKEYMQKLADYGKGKGFDLQNPFS